MSSSKPLHDRVAVRLRQLVRDKCQPGDPLPSLRTLAVQLKVSMPTLRAAQALLCHEGLLEVRHGSGVYATGRATERWIGLLSEQNIQPPGMSYFHWAQCEALAAALRRAGYTPELYVGSILTGGTSDEPSCRRFWEDAGSGRLVGAVILNVPFTDSWRSRVRKLTIPVVGDLTDCEVGFDYPALVRAGLEQLRAQGGRRAALIGWGRDHAEVFLKEAARLGLETREAWMHCDIHPEVRGAGWEEFREIWGASTQKPDCLLITNDNLFEEVKLAILELGIRVPDTLRVATHANKGAPVKYPFPVTRLEFDPVAQAEALAENLLAQLTGKAPTAPVHLLLAPCVLPAGESALPLSRNEDRLVNTKLRTAK